MPSRTLQTAKLCYNDINMYSEKNQSSQFNNVFRKMLSGNKIYTFFFSRFSHVFAQAYVRIWTLRSWRLYIYIFFNLMTDVRECRKGVVFFNVLWINSIFKMNLSNIHSESLVTANRKQRCINRRSLGASILISFLSHPFPSTFKNRTACLPRKVSYFCESRMSPWKIKLDELRSPSFDRFPFLLYVHFCNFTAAGIWVSWNKS